MVYIFIFCVSPVIVILTQLFAAKMKESQPKDLFYSCWRLNHGYHDYGDGDGDSITTLPETPGVRILTLLAEKAFACCTSMLAELSAVSLVLKVSLPIFS